MRHQTGELWAEFGLCMVHPERSAKRILAQSALVAKFAVLVAFVISSVQQGNWAQLARNSAVYAANKTMEKYIGRSSLSVAQRALVLNGLALIYVLMPSENFWSSALFCISDCFGFVGAVFAAVIVCMYEAHESRGFYCTLFILVLGAAPVCRGVMDGRKVYWIWRWDECKPCECSS